MLGSCQSGKGVESCPVSKSQKRVSRKISEGCFCGGVGQDPFRSDYHQSFAQPDFRAVKKGPLWRFSVYFPVFKAEKSPNKSVGGEVRLLRGSRQGTSGELLGNLWNQWIAFELHSNNSSRDVARKLSSPNFAMQVCDAMCFKFATHDMNCPISGL